MDVQDIQPGQDFARAIEHTLTQCDHLLAVVGPRWLADLEARASRPEDFVRSEISVALAHGLTVIPVLVGGAKMPPSDQLPAELAAFGRCQAVEVRDNRFDEDAARLVEFLAGGAGSDRPRPGGVAMRRRALSWGLPALAVLLVGLWVAWPEPAPAPAIDGEWIAQMQKAGQRPYPVGLTLARSGDQVTGFVRYPTGEGPILDGRFDQDRLTFHTSHVPQFESAPATIRFTGTVDGDLIALTSTDEAGTATGVARRAGAVSAGVAGSSTSASRALPSLSYGTWTLRNARDEEGKNWSNSVLQFTSQEEAPDGLILHGRFTWRLNNVLMGTEEISGRYVERTRQVILEGSSVTDADYAGRERLALGSYSAVLAADERSLLQGRWGSTAQNEPGYAGDWEAVR